MCIKNASRGDDKGCKCFHKLGTQRRLWYKIPVSFISLSDQQENIVTTQPEALLARGNLEQKPQPLGPSMYVCVCYVCVYVCVCMCIYVCMYASVLLNI